MLHWKDVGAGELGAVVVVDTPCVVDWLVVTGCIVVLVDVDCLVLDVVVFP